MLKKSPKYHSTKLIVKEIDAALNHATMRNDTLAQFQLKSIREKIIDFDNKMWKQTEEMSEYLPV